MNSTSQPPIVKTSMVPYRMSDGLQNVYTGLGQNNSKRMHNQWAYGALNDYASLEAAYQTNWIARAIVDVPAADMTREWRRIKSKDAEAIEAMETYLNLKTQMQAAIAWARLYGGSGILMMTNQDLGKPLQVNKIKKGDLESLLVFDRWELTPVEYNQWNPLASNFLMPEFYTVYGGAQRIHHSHVARFYGERLPRRMMQQTQGWGDSVLRKSIEDVTDIVAAKGGIAELMQEANVDILTKEGLADDLASDQDDAIVDRYQLFSLMKSNINMALLDGTEVYDRKAVNLTGVAPMFELLMTWTSGAARMPVTKVFGSSAKGLNATGAGDLKNYNDDMRSNQTTFLIHPLKTIDDVMVRSTLGAMPDDYDYVWNPLNEENDVEVAQAELLRSQKHRTYIEDGVIQVSQVQRELQSQEEYQFEDGEIEAREALEDPLLFEPDPNTPPDEVDPTSIPPIGTLATGPE